MRCVRGLLAVLSLSGCVGDADVQRPTAPPSPAPASPAPTEPALPPAPVGAFVYGYVVDASGVCIPGATVRVSRGQGLGRSVAQETPCGAWDYGAGFLLDGLTAGVELTLVASAPGYADETKTVRPALGGQSAIEFRPPRE